MTNKERLDKFKTLYKMKEGFACIICISTDDKFVGAIYRRGEMINKKKEVSSYEEHIFYCRVNTIQEYIEKLSPYVIKKEILIETV